MCTDYRYAKKELNVDVAEKLHALRNFIDNATNLYDLAVIPSYHLHDLEGHRKGQFALDLGRKLGWRLIVIPLDDNGEPQKSIVDLVTLYKSTKAVLAWEVSNHYE